MKKLVNEEVMEYFKAKYQQASFRVVPGHWPNFQTKEEVDEWINSMNELSELAISMKGKRSCPRCKNSEIEPNHNFCKICGLPIKKCDERIKVAKWLAYALSHTLAECSM